MTRDSAEIGRQLAEARRALEIVTIGSPEEWSRLFRQMVDQSAKATRDAALDPETAQRLQREHAKEIVRLLRSRYPQYDPHGLESRDRVTLLTRIMARVKRLV